MSYKSILDNLTGTIPSTIMKPITIVDSDGNIRIVYVNHPQRIAS